MNEQVLLPQVLAISDKYDLLYKKTGGYFNIFEVADIAHDEVVMCRVLYELLSPAGSHFQGNAYLKLFFDHVLNLEMSDAELETARVFREYQIDEQRRIDLVIETSKRFIPIEVKIYAADQANQCYDYYHEAKRRTVNPKIYYLTRFGTAPSEESVNDLSEDDIISLSFSDDILDWLDLCMKQSNTIKIAPIREIIQQLMGVIRKFTNKMGDEKEMEITQLLLSSSDHMKSAMAISSALNEAREAIMYKLLKTIENKVGLQKLDNQYDFEDNDNKKVKSYYSRKNSTYPGISYLYKSKDMIDADKDIWVRFEIEDRTFIGYCCPVEGEATNRTLSSEEIKLILQVEPCIDGWWAYWEYAPNDDEIQSPDFREHNEPYYQLLNEDYFEEFTSVCAERIKELLTH